jgi:two-component system LytT family sensor kinase
VTPVSPAPRRLLQLGIFGGWLLFTLMVIAISWAGAVLRGQNTTLGATLLWNLGWLLWAGGTFLVAYLTRRFPIARENLVRGIATHVALGIGVGVALLLFEFLFAQGLKAIWVGAPRPTAFLGFIVYKFHVYFLIYWMILGATRAYDFYAKYRASELLAAQLETRLAEAQLLALKNQLHPHFLFNTHHAIISLMVRQDSAGAIRMLTQLSDLLRLTLRRPEQQVTALRDELEALQLYLGIQRERYGDRLQVKLDFDPAVLDAEIPWLLLQPLVENALKHGIDTLAGGGELHLQIGRDGENVVALIRDNGPGFPAGFELARNSSGIGLRNTQSRLNRLYGERFTLAFADSEVRVTWPFRVCSVA